MLDGRKRRNITVGAYVEIVQKPNQRSGKITSGIVAKILTKSIQHSHGIKVQLETGIVGRVKNIII